MDGEITIGRSEYLEKRAAEARARLRPGARERAARLSNMSWEEFTKLTKAEYEERRFQARLAEIP